MDLTKFKTDGCSAGISLFWNKILRHPPPWERCCFLHDMEYWAGGTAQDRYLADKNLYKCVLKNGYPIVAFIMYIGVRIGGTAFWPFSLRWSRGSDYRLLKNNYSTRTKERVEAIIHLRKLYFNKKLS